MLPATPPPPPLSAEKMTRHVLPAGVPPPVMELYQQLAQRVTANEQSYIKLQQRMKKLLHVLAHTKKITPEVEKELSGACSQAGGGACSTKSSIHALRKPVSYVGHKVLMEFLHLLIGTVIQGDEAAAQII